MARVYEGRFDARGRRLALVASRFNEFFTRELLAGAEDCLRRHGVPDGDVDVAWVPGIAGPASSAGSFGLLVPVADGDGAARRPARPAAPGARRRRRG